MARSVYQELEREMLEAREERLALEHRQRELAELRRELVGFQLDLAIIKLKRALAQKYRPDQPRVPAGNGGESGRWTTGDRAGLGAAEDSTPEPESRVILAGGFTAEDLNLTVDEFASQYCRGSIQGEIPGQYRSATIAEVLSAAKRGDADANKCKKLLERDRFRK
jgi:hypothetical protein